MMSVQDQIRARLASLNPEFIELHDESSAHAHHAGAAQHAHRTGATAVAAEGTHFELTIVSSAFNGRPLVARHRMIYELLDDLMKTRIHALKIDARPTSPTPN
jgi:BolA family transcriptional regulator, general stress-responsive regulator